MHALRKPSYVLALVAALGSPLVSDIAAATPAPGAAAVQLAGSNTQAGVDATDSSRAFATLNLPRRALYVGESVPITLHAYYSAGTAVTITGTPTLNSPDFTLSLGDAAQGRATIGGEPYLAVTWKGRLSPVKPGRYEVDVRIPSTLEWRTAPRALTTPDDDAFEDPFGDLDSLGMNGDPFAALQQHMQRLMNQALQGFDTGTVQKRTITLESKRLSLDVAAVPEAGRPASFSGAVGRFSLDASVNETHVRAGEPVELRLVVSGDGNWDRVATAGVRSSATLESYPPTSSQTQEAKTFRQALIPRAAGHVEIPPVELAYFDPEAKRYVTARSQPIALTVDPGRALAASGSGAVPNAANGPSLAPNAVADGRAVASLRPLYTRRGFWFAQLLPLGAIAAAASFAGWRKRVRVDPTRRLRTQARRALRRHVVELEAAFAAGDAPAFFAAARGAVQQRLGALWGILPEAITLVEIERRMHGTELDALRTVFEADAARFGPGAAPRELASCRDAVRRVLARPEAS